MVSRHHIWANNPQVKGYDPSKLTAHTNYLDASNLCALTMSKALLPSRFESKRKMPTEAEIMAKKKTWRWYFINPRIPGSPQQLTTGSC